jgi:hypothetical protein
MWCIKNIKLIDFLYENGLQPLYERYGAAYYVSNEKLHRLLDRYTIIHICIPNRCY